MKHRIETPLTREDIKKLKVGDMIELSGVIYTARDAAHEKLLELADAGKNLPFDIENQVIYYVGPCPCPKGRVICLSTTVTS